MGTQLVQSLIHQQVHVLLHQTRCGLRITERVDCRVDLTVSGQWNAVLFHVAQLIDHLSQLVVVVGVVLEHKSTNDVADVLSNSIAGPALRTMRNVVVHAVISVELIQSVQECSLARRADARGVEDVVPG